MATPTMAPRTAPVQPALTLKAPEDLVAEADAWELVALAAFDAPLVMDPADVGLVVAAVLEATGTVVLCEARGAVDWPAIWAETASLKVPDMLSMLNLAEKARAGYWGWVASLRLKDSTRMKYWLLFGPIVGSGVNWMLAVVDTSTLAVMSWRLVCCRALPT